MFKTDKNPAESNSRNLGPTTHAGRDFGRGMPIVMDAPPADLTVPDRLASAYDAAPSIPDRDLGEWLVRAHTERAARADAAAAREYVRRYGTALGTPDRPSYDAVIAGGPTDEDFEYAQHLRRMDYAERKVSAAEQAAEAEARRQAAKCTNCGVLDVPTRLPVVTLTAEVSTGPRTLPVPGTVAKLGGGVVCAECETTISDLYRANLASQSVGKRRTRLDAARDYLNRLPAKLN